MTYHVHDLFLTRQGEGNHAGRRAVFCRFSGCNLWSGREQDRHTALCRWCDTEFVGYSPQGGAFQHADSLAHAARNLWDQGNEETNDPSPYLVLTGGEPMLQIDPALLRACKNVGFTIALETNGSILISPSLHALMDWITVSPKARAPWQQRNGHELKIVWPQHGFTHGDLATAASYPFQHHLLQPCQSTASMTPLRHMTHIMAYCHANPPWRMSLQLHKLWRIP